jgi:hypothetical protein
MKGLLRLVVMPILCWAPSGLACTLDDATKAVQFNAAQQSRELAKQAAPLLQRLERLNAKATTPGKPLNQQLSSADIAERRRLQQRIGTLQLQDRVESAYWRDVRVIREMLDVARRVYADGQDLPASHPKHALFSHLQALRRMRELPEYRGMFITTPGDFTVCSMEVALHLIESESFSRLEKMPVAEMTKQLDAIRARNQQPLPDALDPARLSPEDKAAYERIQRDNAPVFRERALISDLEGLKGLAKLAAMKFEADRKDAADAGGDATALGRTIATQVVDNRRRFYLAILAKIADDYPSDWDKQMQGKSTGEHGPAGAKVHDRPDSAIGTKK